jgi:hypothetical protein
MGHKRETFTNKFGAPEVRGEKETIGTGSGVCVNVPASGEVRLSSEQAKEIAKFIKNNEGSLFFEKFFTGDSDCSPKEFAKALEEAAKYAKEDN